MNRMTLPSAAVISLRHGLQPLLELAAIFGAGDQRAEVEREQLLVLQALRHVAVDDAQRQALDDRRLADAGLADQHRVVLGAPRQHLDGAADFLVAADDRVELAVARRRVRSRVYFFRASYWLSAEAGIGGAALADFLDGGVQRLRRDAGVREDLRRAGVLLHRQREQQPLDRDERVAGLLGDLLGGVENLGGRRRQIELAAARR